MCFERCCTLGLFSRATTQFKPSRPLQTPAQSTYPNSLPFCRFVLPTARGIKLYNKRKPPSGRPEIAFHPSSYEYKTTNTHKKGNIGYIEKARQAPRKWIYMITSEERVIIHAACVLSMRTAFNCRRATETSPTTPLSSTPGHVAADSPCASCPAGGSPPPHYCTTHGRP